MENLNRKTDNAFEQCEVCGVPNFLHATYCGWENAGMICIPELPINLNDTTPKQKEAAWHFWKPFFRGFSSLGVQLIDKERREQVEKHGRTLTHDIVENTFNQLTDGAMMLLMEDRQKMNKPSNWDKEIWLKMINKPYKERLIISGALIAAEIDRVIYNESDTVEVDEETYNEITGTKTESDEKVD